MDEIFHSTNARDGVEASRIFLDRLYTARDGSRVSIISTHYRELPEYYGDRVQCLQVVARMREDDTIDYTYRVAEGVSAVSSVRELLRERGLLCPAGAAAAA
jgi:DNA mismatch repair ATPase MutS